MKYKLIKLLPFENSPRIGYTSEPHLSQKDEDHYWNGLWFNPENYPEFWEKVKDYEILSLIEDKFIYPCDKYGKDFINQLFNTLGVSIHSVKRKDGEIFTIGDKVIGYNNSITKIKTIDLVGEISLNIGTDKHEGFSLNNLKKVKQPLFTTEDGIDIFENNISIYHVDKSLNIKFIKHKDFKVISKNVKYFSTKEKAEEYILMNKPCLSINEITNLTETNPPDWLNKELIKIVKSKKI